MDTRGAKDTADTAEYLSLEQRVSKFYEPEPRVRTRVEAAGMSLSDVVRWMSEAPARLAGLPRKGGIAVGKDADLVAFAPDARFTVGRLEHRNPVTPYAGLELDGVVRRTWVRGQVADGAPIGRLLTRGG